MGGKQRIFAFSGKNHNSFSKSSPEIQAKRRKIKGSLFLFFPSILSCVLLALSDPLPLCSLLFYKATNSGFLSLDSFHPFLSSAEGLVRGRKEDG